jgi:gamma-glutamyltranspeptidase/glutathione hydrolase
VLREGGNVRERMIAAAATIAVAYPHTNPIGGVAANTSAGTTLGWDAAHGGNIAPHRAPRRWRTERRR